MLISLVVPTYNVAAYLPEFLDSLDAQKLAPDKYEVVFVDDGSTDDSGEIIRSWIAAGARNAGGRANARIVSKPNGGLSSARNAGLDVATGDWVTFCDPDDVLTPTYLGVVHRFVSSRRAHNVQIVAGKHVYLNDEDRTRSDTHPLRFRFTEGNRVMDLERHPHFIHVAANTGFFRRAVLNEFGLRFDERVQPVWEDGHLTGRYLAKFERPRLAVMADAIYLYRRRSDGSSLMQGSWTKTGKYLDVPRHGWLDMLQTVAAERGHVPKWAQNIAMYDLVGYFKQEERSPSPTAGVPAVVAEEFLDILEQVLTFIDPETIEDFQVNWVSQEIRLALLLGLKGLDPRPREVVLNKLDRDRRLVRFSYYYTGAAPVEEFRARGMAVRPVHAKTRGVRFFGRVLMYQRTAWLPANGTLALTLDGRQMPLWLGGLQTRQYTVGPTAVWNRLARRKPPTDNRSERATRPGGLRARVGARTRIRRARRWRRDASARLRAWADPSRIRRQWDDALTLRLARSWFARRRYGRAWLLIDRDSQAQDNAEYLYRYLRDEQRQVNAWFVLSRDSRDWDRLSRDGFRLVAHGSRQHVIALKNAEHLLSSQIDHYIVRPLDWQRFGPDTWHYTFLQHGVTKDDLSRWINSKPVDLMITATPDEHEYIVGDGSPYAFGTKEVRLTGFPRHDRLLALARARTPSEEKLLLIMPTWRRELLLGQKAGGNDRHLLENFWQTTYATEWRKVLESERLQSVAAAHGWQIAFIPHPNMQDYLTDSPLPSHVRTHQFRDVDIQQTLARAATLVTDFSSIAFDVAYLERPVVYFQFDQDTFFNGMHAYRRGTWSYEENGFGPVTVDAESAIEAITAILERGGTADPLYAERMRSTFPFRDGQCSRRTYEAVLDVTRPLTYDELYQRVDQPAGSGAPVEDADAAVITVE